jgi:hypothetical protein
MLYTLYPNTKAATTDDGGVVAFDTDNATETSTEAPFSLTIDNWKLSNEKGAKYSTTNTYKISGYWYFSNKDNTLTIPEGKEVTKITFVGYNVNNGDVYLKTLGNLKLSSTDYTFPARNLNNQPICTSTIIPKEAFTGTLTITFSKTSCFKIYVTYKNSATE